MGHSSWQTPRTEIRSLQCNYAQRYKGNGCAEAGLRVRMGEVGGA